MVKNSTFTYIVQGFIDKEPSSSNFGGFTVSATDLNLFSYDSNLGRQLQVLQSETANEPNNFGSCKVVLDKLYTGCDPDKVSRNSGTSAMTTVLSTEFSISIKISYYSPGIMYKSKHGILCRLH